MTSTITITITFTNSPFVPLLGRTLEAPIPTSGGNKPITITKPTS